MPAARPSRPRIELIADDEHPGGTMLVMDDVRQSYVDIDDPTYLDFEYVQYFASVLRRCRPARWRSPTSAVAP
jgi:hypothetical protein